MGEQRTDTTLPPLTEDQTRKAIAGWHWLRDLVSQLPVVPVSFELGVTDEQIATSRAAVRELREDAEAIEALGEAASAWSNQLFEVAFAVAQIKGERDPLAQRLLALSMAASHGRSDLWRLGWAKRDAHTRAERAHRDRWGGHIGAEVTMQLNLLTWSLERRGIKLPPEEWRGMPLGPTRRQRQTCGRCRGKSPGAARFCMNCGMRLSRD